MSTGDAVHSESMRYKQDKLLIFGYVRSVIALQTLPPHDLIDLCVLFYHLDYEILKWSKKFHNDAFTFHDNNEYVIFDGLNKDTGWIQADIVPIYKGSACFRIKVE